jgi:hypothetical protein
MAAKSRMKPMMSPRDGCLHTVHSEITVYCPLLGQCFTNLLHDMWIVDLSVQVRRPQL